jgi:hypothetical protein
MHASTIRPKVMLLPSTKAQLHIGTRTITGHYPVAIRLAASEPDIRAFLQEQNKWDKTHLDFILWPALKNSISKNSHRHVQVVKLLHGLLPTAKYRQKFENSPNPECSLCHNGNEDWTQVLRCLHPSQQTWRNKLLIALRLTCEKYSTREALVSILIDGLHAWLHYTTINTEDYPAVLRHLIQEQHSLGWGALLRGFWSSRWAQVQDARTSPNN